MHRLTKLLIAGIAVAVVQTLNAATLFQNVLGWGVAAFGWGVVAVVAWRRTAVL